MYACIHKSRIHGDRFRTIKPPKEKQDKHKKTSTSVFKRNLIVSITSLSAHDKKNIRGKRRRLNEPQGTSRTAKVQKNSLQRAHLAIILPPPTSHHQKKKTQKEKTNKNCTLYSSLNRLDQTNLSQ
jgi:hypothetical protein